MEEEEIYMRLPIGNSPVEEEQITENLSKQNQKLLLGNSQDVLYTTVVS